MKETQTAKDNCEGEAGGYGGPGEKMEREAALIALKKFSGMRIYKCRVYFM